jgi:hypothetical protein
VKPTPTEPISAKLFKAKACIDWLELEITTTRPTQFRYIKRAFDHATGCSTHAEPLDAGPGDVATRFKVRFYDDLANSMQALKAALDKVALSYPPKTPPAVLALELACDFSHKGTLARREADTLAMTHRLQTSLHAEASKPRQFIPDVTGKAKGQNRFMDRPGMRMDPRFNYRIGNTHDEVSWQVYFKCVDKQAPIPESEWRARVEVTLQGLALTAFGITHLDELAAFSFERMAYLFRFRRPTDPTKQARGNLFIREAIQAKGSVPQGAGREHAHRARQRAARACPRCPQTPVRLNLLAQKNGTSKDLVEAARRSASYLECPGS